MTALHSFMGLCEDVWIKAKINCRYYCVVHNSRKPTKFHRAVIVKPRTCLNSLMLKVTLEIFVCIFDTFHNNQEMKNNLAIYLKERCWLCYD